MMKFSLQYSCCPAWLLYVVELYCYFILRSHKMDLNTVVIDAVPQQIPCDSDGQNALSVPTCLEPILNKLKIEDYISVFFLLLDYVKYDGFLYLVKIDVTDLKHEFIDLCKKNKFNEKILIEIFGTIKNFEVLNKLGTCQHFFKAQAQQFCKIKKFWKLLYYLCEEVTDEELHSVKQKLFPNILTCNMKSAEEMFCLACKNKVVSETNLTRLLEVFEDRPECISLINQFIEESRCVDYYNIRRPTKFRHCGKAVIVNHSKFEARDDNRPSFLEREGSHLDVEALKSLWKEFGFEIEIYSNLFGSEVRELFINLSKEDYSMYDAFIVCYLSHGSRDAVYASDNEKISIWSLKDIIANKCPTLAEKPKLFFIQACQGLIIQQGIGSPVYDLSNDHETCIEMNEETKLDNIPHFSDVLTVTATYPGYVSFRSPKEGSWFIASLVDVMKRHGEDWAISDIISKVTAEVAEKRGSLGGELRNCKQIVFTETTLRKSLKLKKVS